MQLHRLPAGDLRGHLTGYWGFEESTAMPMRRREGPGSDVVVIMSFGNDWLIDGARRRSFVGGLRRSQVTTEHGGWSHGIHIGVVPWAAHVLLRVPMNELADTTVPLDELLPGELTELLANTPEWDQRFALLDRFFSRRLAEAQPATPAVVWAWKRLVDTHGSARVGSLAEELGWSRKRLVARFREQIGLPPKAVARLLRFERARQLSGSMGWANVAVECGFADQSHLIAEFRAFTGRTPETFLQDTAVGPGIA